MRTYENMARQECTDFACFNVTTSDLKERAARGDRAAVAELARRAHNRAEKRGSTPSESRYAWTPSPTEDKRVANYMKAFKVSKAAAVRALAEADASIAFKNGFDGWDD